MTDHIATFALPSPTQRRVVVGDIHTDVAALRDLLKSVDAIDTDGNRNPDVWVGSVGDVIHGGHDSYMRDGETLEVALRWIDAFVLGNHETPFSHGVSSFAGRHTDLEPMAQRLLNASVRADRWKIAMAVDGWLITHAGVHPKWFGGSMLPNDLLGNPERVAATLNDLWVCRLTERTTMPVFEQIGHRRGGAHAYGGVLWCDWRELKSGYGYARNFPLRQLVGHSPQEGPRAAADGKLINIDLGARLSGKLAAAVKNPGDDTWETVSVDRRVDRLSRP